MKQPTADDSHPHHIAAADFNKDGHLDIVVANAGTDSIGVFLNNHNGTFAPQITYSTGSTSRPYSVAIGDFNNDTHLDIVVANFGINSIGVHLGYGNGSFTNAIITSLGSSHPLFVAVGDLNNDSILDVVVTNYGTANIAVLLGINDGSFRMHHVYEMGYDSLPYSLALADLNNDHRLDIIVVNYGTSELVVLLAHLNQTFSLHQYWTGAGSHPSSVTTGHFNDDNALDIAVAYSGTGSIGIFLGHGNGTFTNQMKYSIDTLSRPQFIGVSNFNNDTQVDIIVVDSAYDNIVIFKGYGNGSFSIITRHSTGYSSGPSALAIGDFDNDQRMDVVISNNGTNNIVLLSAFSIRPATIRTEYRMGNARESDSIVLADFNHDNYIDIVILDNWKRKVEAHLNLGNRTFREQHIDNISTSFLPSFVVVGDVNNDHHPDIVVALRDESSIGILLGYGDGNFVLNSTFLTKDNFFTLFIALDDLNDDGNLDIVTADYGTRNIYLGFGFGNGTFTNMIVLFNRIDFHPSFLLVTKINGDKNFDIVGSNGGSNGGIVILLGYGNGSFHNPLFVSTNGDVADAFAIDDVNSDGQTDIVYISHNAPGIGVLLGKGNGTFENIMEYFGAFDAGLRSISLGYYNDDTFLDAAATIQLNSDINIYLGTGNGSFKMPMKLSTGEEAKPCSVTFADFDNDGQQDVVVGDATLNIFQIFFVYSDTDFTKMASYTTGSNPHPFSISTGDLDGDGQSDLAIANSGNNDIQLLINYNKNIFMNKQNLSTGLGSHPQSVTIAYLNQDHFLDIAVVNTWDDNFNVFFGLGNGSFSRKYIYSTGTLSTPSSIVAGDLNEDGRMDIVTANEGSDTVGIFLASEYVLFSTYDINIPGSSPLPSCIASGDFNNDHLLDIVIGNRGTYTLGIYFGYGNGTFSEQITISIESDPSPNYLAVGDFNNDNCQDLVFVSSDINAFCIFLGYGNGSFQSPLSYSTGDWSSPYSVAVADFNKDSQLDIVVVGANEDIQGTVWLFLGFGNGTFERSVVYTITDGTYIRSVAVDDLNNDTFLDIVFVNPDANSICLLFGFGDGHFSNATTLSTGENSQPVSVALGDLNGDKSIDIVVANRLSATVLLFFGYGNETFSTQNIAVLHYNASVPSILLSDVNSDNLLDILFIDEQLNGGIGIFYGFGGGKFASLKFYATGSFTAPSMAAVGDFNNDSRIDLAICKFYHGSIGVFIQSAIDLYASPALFPTGNQSHPSAIVLGDFNNDHHLDIAVANSMSNTIGIFLGYGNGDFAHQRTYSTGSDSHPSALSVNYFNDDHYLDVAVVNSAMSTVAIFLGNENGSMTHLISYSTGISSAPVAITAKDLNRDNHSDLVVANRGSNEVLIYLGSGNGTFIEEKRYSMNYNARPQSVVIGDINGDKMLDIAIANDGTGNVEVLLQTC